MTELGITPVMTHGETAAAYMADGYARVSRRPGLCGSQAIGSTNLAAGLRDAYMARSPVIAFSGGPIAATRHRNLYQEVDDMPVFERFTKFNAVVDDPARLPDLLRQAYRAATTGITRPVHLEFAGFWGNVTAEATDAAPEVDTRYACAPAVRQCADPDLVGQAVEHLMNAKRPVILAGGGVKRSAAEGALRDFARIAKLPVATSLNGMGVMGDADPLSVGVVGDYARDCANRTIAEADLVVVVGSALGSLTTRNWALPPAKTRIIHIDIDAAEIGRNYPDSLPLVGDARLILDQLVQAARNLPDRSAWLSRVAGFKSEWSDAAVHLETSAAAPIRPERLMRAISNAAPDDAIIVSDTGHAGAWCARHLYLKETQTFIRAAGSLGWGFPAAIGAKCAAPNRPVICFTGDGGFYFNLVELETARRYGVNLVIVVNNNSCMNQEAVLWDVGNAKQEKNWRFCDTDFVSVAESLGCTGLRVSRPHEIEPAIATALLAKTPVVVDVRTDPAAIAPPSWSPDGKRSHE
jgi:acetolactate synthase-1/2/3 large subunit